MIKTFLLSLFLVIASISSYGQDSLAFLALGDSYTIGESVDESSRWPVQLSKMLNSKGFLVKHPVIIAKTGWRTDQLKTAIMEADMAKEFDLVGLLIGVNNQYQGKSPESYQPEFQELLEIAIAHAGGDASKVFVVSIPDYGYTPFGEKDQKRISKELDQYNAINKSITEKAGVTYIYITDISRNTADKDLVAEDGLHPSGKQYRLWVEAMLQDDSLIKKLK